MGGWVREFSQGAELFSMRTSLRRVSQGLPQGEEITVKRKSRKLRKSLRSGRSLGTQMVGVRPGEDEKPILGSLNNKPRSQALS